PVRLSERHFHVRRARRRTGRPVEAASSGLVADDDQVRADDDRDSYPWRRTEPVRRGRGPRQAQRRRGSGTRLRPRVRRLDGLHLRHGPAHWLPSTIDPSDLNQASIAIGDLHGVQTVTRTVTNVGPRATYTVTVTAPPGIGVVVNPTTLTLSTGESASYSVTFTRTGAAFATFPNGFQVGSLTWSDGAG